MSKQIENAQHFANKYGYELRVDTVGNYTQLRFNFWKRLSTKLEDELYEVSGATISSINGNPKHDRYYYEIKN